MIVCRQKIKRVVTIGCTMPSVEKVFTILELLRKNFRTGLTNKEISEALDIPTSTCYRILASLKKHDLVYQRKPDLHYFLGFAHLRYAEAVIEGMDISAICLPYLEDIHTETEETTFFTLLSGHHCVVMEMCGLTNVRIAVGLGEIMPLHCSAAGKAVLAFLNEREQERILSALELDKYTDKTITDVQALRSELKKIRESGISQCVQEFHKGINAIAVPVFNSNRIFGSLALVGTSVDLDDSQMQEYGALLLSAGSEITEKLGGTYPVELE